MAIKLRSNPGCNLIAFCASGSIKVNISFLCIKTTQWERSAAQKKTNSVDNDGLLEPQSNNKAKVASLNCCDSLHPGVD